MRPMFGPFRRLDGADAAVVGGVNVADLEAGPLAGEASGSEGRETPLVRDLAERVRLVHELRELRGAEELLDHRRDRLGVDQVVRHERLDLLQAHALLDGALHADETDPVLVLEQLAHRPDAAVAEVVDVVDVPILGAVLQIDEEADHLEHVALGEHRVVERLLDAELVVELEPADLGEVVALRVEEEVVEEGCRGVRRRRIARAKPAVDLHHRLLRRRHLVLHQGVAQRGKDVQPVDEEHLEGRDAALAQLLDLLLGDLLVHLEDDLAGGLVDHVLGGVLLGYLLGLDGERLDLGGDQLLDGAVGELAVLLDHHLAGAGVLDVAGGALPLQEVGGDVALVLALALDADGLGVVVVLEDLLRRPVEVDGILLGGVRDRADGPEQHRGRQLAPPIDAHVEHVLVIELEVDPGAAVRDDAGVVEDLARRVALALVVVEEGARAAVQLADDDALGAVDDEGAVVGHQRDLAEVDLLLLHVPDGLRARLLVLVPDHEPDDHLDGRGEGHPPLVALVHVVLGLLEVVAHELERARLVEVPDGEDRLEDSLEPGVVALLRRDLGLQELVVRPLLNGDQVGDVRNLLDLPEILAGPEIGLDRRRHRAWSSFPRKESLQALRADARPAHDFMPGREAGGRG